MGVRQREIQALTSPADRKLYEEYVLTRRELARLTLAPADPLPDRMAERRVQLTKLSSRKEQLERSLAESVAEFRGLKDKPDRPHADLIEHLPPNHVFVDVLCYGDSEMDPDVPGISGARMTPRYIAFLLSRDRPIVYFRLGQAEPIDEAAKLWHENTAALRADSAAETLGKLVWEPIEKHLPPGTTTIFLCPDGALTSIPWSALPGRKENTILLEEYSLATVPNGQFLLERLMVERPTQDQRGVLLAVGGVSYDDKPTPLPQSSQLVTREAVTGKEEIHWSPLPGTKHELDELERVAGKRQVSRLTGSDASTARVLAELPKARWAHIATHGFFADPKIRSALQLDERNFARQQFLGPIERTTVAGRNPLIMSGLVLAGANVPRPRDEFGISQGDGGLLTAEAIAVLPLRNLELVVLSACKTASGEVAGGEGVFGLQRAFHLAGAHNVIASLWEVDDQATAALMRLFYHKLWVEEKPPIVALRESQLALYRNPDNVGDLATTRGPDFTKVVKRVEATNGTGSKKTAPTKVWAAFVLSGAGR
jgi:CHAT domain-containing protein